MFRLHGAVQSLYTIILYNLLTIPFYSRLFRLRFRSVFYSSYVVREKDDDGNTSKKACYAVFFKTNIHIIQKNRS